MTRLFTLMLAISACLCLGARAASDGLAKMAKCRPYVAVANDNTNAKRLAAFAGQPDRQAGPKRTIDEAAHHATATDWGYLTGPDGTTWHYTQTFTEHQEDYFYQSSTITIFDDTHRQVGQFTVRPGGIRTNKIEPFGTVTEKLFDRDQTSREVTVYVHEPTEDYKNRDSVFVYRLDGSLAGKYEGNGPLFDVQKDRFTRYQRMVLSREVEQGDSTVIYTDVYGPAGWNGTEPQLLHTFKSDFAKVMYSNGPYLNLCNVGGKPYYVHSYYEKPFVLGYDSNNDIVPAPDNHYILLTYDENFRLVDSIAVPLDGKRPDALYRFASFGMFSGQDLSRGFYTDDDRLNYVITFSDYMSATDSEIYTFAVYDPDGGSVKTICDGVTDFWQRLRPMPGHEDQWAFLRQDDQQQTLQFVDIPSCNIAATMPADIDGNTISTNINRYPHGESYEYAVQMGFAETDANGNCLARIGWYHPDLTLDHFTTFNLGTGGELFNPLLSDEALDPHLFDTDDAHEYIYIAKIRRADGSKLDNTLFIAKEDGTVVKKWVGDDRQSFINAALLNYPTANRELLIGLIDRDYNYDLNYIPLPLTGYPLTGAGTKDDPYLLRTAGDMQLIARDTKAHYRLDADIDMAVSPCQWKAIDSFAGTLDGAGHTLGDIHYDGSGYYAALFASLEPGVIIKDLNLLRPTLHPETGCNYAAFIAGTTTTDTLTNIHIKDATLASPVCEAATGGLIGEASIYTTIDRCSLTGQSTIDMPAAEMVGAIAGNIRTGSTIQLSAATGTNVRGANTVGGIAGQNSNDATITDCHFRGNIAAAYNAGGIVGISGRGLIARCAAEGTLTADTCRWGAIGAGGIAGKLESDWTASTATAITDCLSQMDIYVLKAQQTYNSVHHIAGTTIANEPDDEDDPDAEPLTEKCLAKNYNLPATNEALPLGLRYTATTTDDTIPDGKTITPADLTETFLTTLGYQLGNNPENPWKLGAFPALYFEETTDIPETSDINCPKTTATATNDAIYNLAGQRLHKAPKTGVYIKGGKVHSAGL